MMKRRTRWMIAVAVTVALLHGCQASNTPLNVPGQREESRTTEQLETLAGAPETTEPGMTELPANTESTAETEAPTEAATEPKATEPKTTEPKTTEPKPTEPKPTEPKATEPKPTEPKPTEPKPTEPKPTEPKPTEPKPTEPKPTEPKPTEPEATEPTPTNPPCTHRWYMSQMIKDPTCKDDGEAIRTCDRCGCSEHITIPAAPSYHYWQGWTQTKAPTCAAEGTESRTCSRCGNTETRTVAATGNHSWNETVPTCTAAGAKTCTTCGKQENGAAALGHDWVHHDEEGEYRPVITCYCGMRFIGKPEDISDAESAWLAHFYSFERADRDNHGGYEAHEEWFVTTPAYAECSHCGTTK